MSNLDKSIWKPIESSRYRNCLYHAMSINLTGHGRICNEINLITSPKNQYNLCEYLFCSNMINQSTFFKNCWIHYKTWIVNHWWKNNYIMYNTREKDNLSGLLKCIFWSQWLFYSWNKKYGHPTNHPTN